MVYARSPLRVRIFAKDRSSRCQSCKWSDQTRASSSQQSCLTEQVMHVLHSYTYRVATTSYVDVSSPSVPLSAFLFFTWFPRASTPPAMGMTLLAVNTYPSLPPLLVISGCVRPGRTWCSLTRLVCIEGPKSRRGSTGKSSLSGSSPGCCETKLRYAERRSLE